MGRVAIYKLPFITPSQPIHAFAFRTHHITFACSEAPKSAEKLSKEEAAEKEKQDRELRKSIDKESEIRDQIPGLTEQVTKKAFGCVPCL